MAGGGTTSGWVIAAFVERVTAADSPDPLERASDRPVLLHRLNKVAAAGRMKAALLAKNRAQKYLIEPHDPNKTSPRKINQRFPEGC